MSRLIIRTQGGIHEVVGGCAGHVASPTGTVHQAADKSMKTRCGLTFISYFMNYYRNEEDAVSWPTTDDPVDCGRCKKIDPNANFDQKASILAQLAGVKIHHPWPAPERTPSTVRRRPGPTRKANCWPTSRCREVAGR